MEAPKNITDPTLSLGENITIQFLVPAATLEQVFDLLGANTNVNAICLRSKTVLKSILMRVYGEAYANHRGDLDDADWYSFCENISKKIVHKFYIVHVVDLDSDDNGGFGYGKKPVLVNDNSDKRIVEAIRLGARFYPIINHNHANDPNDNNIADYNNDMKTLIDTYNLADVDNLIIISDSDDGSWYNLDPDDGTELNTKDNLIEIRGYPDLGKEVRYIPFSVDGIVPRSGSKAYFVILGVDGNYNDKYCRDRCFFSNDLIPDDKSIDNYIAEFISDSYLEIIYAPELVKSPSLDHAPMTNRDDFNRGRINLIVYSTGISRISCPIPDRDYFIPIAKAITHDGYLEMWDTEINWTKPNRRLDLCVWINVYPIAF